MERVDGESEWIARDNLTGSAHEQLEKYELLPGQHNHSIAAAGEPLIPIEHEAPPTDRSLLALLLPRRLTARTLARSTSSWNGLVR